MKKQKKERARNQSLEAYDVRTIFTKGYQSCTTTVQAIPAHHHASSET